MPLSKIQFGNTGRRNIVINGGMQIAQRGTSSTSTGYCSLDRYRIHPNNMDNLAYTWAQDNTVPTGEGFGKSAKVTVTTAESALAADEIWRVLHRIEGQNLQQASWGTSGAKPLTLSFYVRSNVTGTYAVEFRMNAGGNNSLSKNYTISAANTWERKTITFPANTSTNFNNAATEGCELGWYLSAGTNYTSGSLASDYGANAQNTRAAGQTANVASANSNTWFITGIQLEVGDSATEFEHRSVGEELALCQRYFVDYGLGSNAPSVISIGRDAQYGHIRGTQVSFPVTMRANPTVVIQSGSANSMDRYGRGQETCYPQAEGMTTFGFDVVRSRDSSGNNRTWTDNGLYMNRAGYSAEAEL